MENYKQSTRYISSHQLSILLSKMGSWKWRWSVANDTLLVFASPLPNEILDFSDIFLQEHGMENSRKSTRYISSHQLSVHLSKMGSLKWRWSVGNDALHIFANTLPKEILDFLSIFYKSMIWKITKNLLVTFAMINYPSLFENCVFDYDARPLLTIHCTSSIAHYHMKYLIFLQHFLQEHDMENSRESCYLIEIMIQLWIDWKMVVENDTGLLSTADTFFNFAGSLTNWKLLVPKL